MMPNTKKNKDKKKRTRQQAETYLYFKTKADVWAQKAADVSETKVNVIKQRNDYVINIARSCRAMKASFDIGCGTGDLVCALLRAGMAAEGLDFSERMIKIAKAKAQNIRSSKSLFYCSSVFDFEFSENKYDLISANGFIEYISRKELVRLLKICYRAMRDGGSLVLSARNRLFNIMSLNQFTEEEIACGQWRSLVEEAIRIVRAKRLEDLYDVQSVRSVSRKRMSYLTDVKVGVRMQYTPVQLIRILQKTGYVPVDISPIHIHGVVPSIRERYPHVHASISKYLQTCTGEKLCFIPQSSAFMIHVRKPCKQ